MSAENIVDSDIWENVFVRNQDIVSRKIAGELFLVPVKGNLAHMEQIFTLTPVAEYIWDRLDGQKSIHDIRCDIVENFEVEHEQASSDIQEFINELLGAELIQTIST
jgi:hypothetical protein